jgi:hypothetical protein
VLAVATAALVLVAGAVRVAGLVEVVDVALVAGASAVAVTTGRVELLAAVDTPEEAWAAAPWSAQAVASRTAATMPALHARMARP